MRVVIALVVTMDVVLLPACGRVGYRLVQGETAPSGVRDGSVTDASADATLPNADAAMDAGGSLDGALDGGSILNGDAAGDSSLGDSGAGTLPGLIAWYRFEDDPTDGVLDSSGAGRDGSCATGDCPTVASGRIGMAYDLDGVDDFVLVDDSDGYFDGSAGFSVAVWTFVRGSNVQAVVSKAFGSDFDNSWGIAMSPPDVAYVDTIVPAMDPSPGSFELNQWIHYAITWDGATGRLYRDGSSVQSFVGPVTFDTNGIVVGGDQNRGTDFAFLLDGLVDELMVFDRALAVAEVASLANP